MTVVHQAWACWSKIIEIPYVVWEAAHGAERARVRQVANTIAAAHPDKPRPASTVTALARLRTEVAVVPTQTGDQLVGGPAQPLVLSACSGCAWKVQNCGTAVLLRIALGSLVLRFMLPEALLTGLHLRGTASLGTSL